MKRILFILSILSTTIFGQQAKVYNEYLEPIEDIEVISVLTKKSIFTDEKGSFNLKGFAENDTLYFYNYNYLPLSIPKTQLTSILHNKVLMHYQNTYLEGVEATVTVRNKKKQFTKNPVKIDVLNNEKIHKIGAQSSAEVLEQASGVQIQKSQAGGGSPMIRGMEANKVLLVIDGVRMNNAIYRGGHLQNSITLDNNILEQVDVSYGPGSVNYGSDALGGVIHYYTKTPINRNDTVLKFQGNLSSSYASGNNGLTTHADFTLNKNKWGSLTSISYKKFGDLKMGKNRQHGYENWGKVYNRRIMENGIDSMIVNTDTNTQLNTGYEQMDILQKIVYAPNKNVDFILNTQYSNSTNINRYDQLGKYSSGEFKYAEWYYGPQTRFLAALTTNIKKKTKFFDNAAIIASIQQIEESRITRRFKKNERIERIEDVKVGALNLDFSKELKAKTKLFYGAELTHNIVNSKAHSVNIATDETAKQSTRYPDNGSSMSTGAIYANLTQTYEKFLWNFGNRLTLTNLEANFKDTTYVKLPFSNISSQSQAFSSSLGFVYTPINSFKINTNFSSGFRTPNIDDFGKVFENDDYVVIPNNQIKPEFVYTGELGISKSFSRIYNEADGTKSNIHFATISATGFYTLLDNLIIRSDFQLNNQDSLLYEGSMKKIQANQNYDTGEIYGISGGVNISFNENIKLKSTINYTAGRVTSSNEPMSKIPPVFGRTSLILDQAKWDLELYSIYNGWKRIADYDQNGNDNDDEATIDGTPSWYTLNIRGSFQFNSKISMQAGIQNIMDIHYKTFSSGISAMGRSINLALKVSI